MGLDYTSYDIAVFLLTCNLSVSEEKIMLQTLWTLDNESLEPACRCDYSAFRQQVKREISRFEYTKRELHELQLLLADTCLDIISKTQRETDAIESYFKIIKLKLLYGRNKDYHRIKVRRLLTQFGYQRRSTQLILRLEHVMECLSLGAFLKGGIACRLDSIALDDMVTIRLKNEFAI